MGSKVYAFGNREGLTNTMSDGLISGLRKAADALTGAEFPDTQAAGAARARLRLRVPEKK